SGGEILRYPDSGEATGMLIDEAMGLVDRIVPPATQAEIEQALITGAQREISLGWTGVQIAGHDYAEAETVRRLVAAGKIRLRIYDAVSAPGADADQLFAAGPVLGESDGRYTRRGVKLYIDGALGSRGAALLAPYSDYASSGLLLNSPAKLRPFLQEALRRGIQVQTHAIGDRGNRTMLDLYEEALATVPAAERKVAEPRWRIEHAQVLSAADIPRFARLGIIASMQPSHAIGDLYFAPKRLGSGSERLAGAYAWQSLLQTGAAFTGGSDAPVERGEPLIEFYAAVARRSPDGFADADWHLEQRLTREQALRAFTLGAAYAAFEENERGTIEVGKRADFTVLSADIMTIPEPEILRAHCLMTIVGGEVVYTAPDGPAVR
ncbi:MAG: amidohydrolase, partial [bacterium]|nr:amidohydrolase [bacterium]